jgi:hypothetical protein
MEATYRNVKYFINEQCSGLKESICPEHFSRYFTRQEMQNVTVEVMEKGIDRMLAKAPIYKGDLRERR